MEQLTSNVFVESKLYPTVSFVVTSEGIVAIDTPMDPHSAAEWRRFIESKGKLRYIINTEFHADHIMGNAFFPGVIVTSEHNREHFLDSVKSNENVRKMFLQFFPNSGDITKSYNLRWPDITFRQRMSLCLGGTEFLILCSPGHTLGQTIVHVPGERVLMAADNIVYGAPPFFHAADLSCWFGSLAMLESLDVEWFIPGHGIPCKKDWIPRLREILYGIINEVRKAKKCGLSRQEAQRAVQYIDRPEFEFPDFLAEACRNLEEVGIGNIYDQLEAHPGL